MGEPANADSLKVSWLARSQFWSESKIYLTVVWSMIIIGSIIILSGRAADPPDHRRLGWRGRDGLLLDTAPRAQPPGAAGSHQAQELPPRDNSFSSVLFIGLSIYLLYACHRADTIGRYAVSVRPGQSGRTLNSLQGVHRGVRPRTSGQGRGHRRLAGCQV